MDGFVARQNIEHYREMLKITTDPVRRRQIEICFWNKKTSSKNTKKIIKRNNNSPRSGGRAEGAKTIISAHPK